MESVYTAEQIKDIAGHLLEELREMPDGSATSSAGLLEKCGYVLEDFGDAGLLSFHSALTDAAGSAGIRLIFSEDETCVNKPVYDAEFAVKNKRAQIRCPYCGSRKTARILYGKLFFTKELQLKLDSGKVVLRGCCIETAEVDGRPVNIMPKRHCNKCGKDFGAPADGGLIKQKMQEEASADERNGE